MSRTISKRVLVVFGDMIDDAGAAPVRIGAAQLLGGNDLAGRRFHQRRTAEENGALAAHDHRLVAHRRHVGAARRAGAHDAGDLRNAGGLIRAWLKKMRPK